MEYFETNLLLTRRQYGCRKGFSTEKAICDLSTLISENFETQDYTLCSFYDLSKAFDCVPHELLLGKLRKYGLTEHSTTLIQSYLTDRVQAVRRGDVISSYRPVNIGIPQGGCISGALFIIFTNDFVQINDSEAVDYIVYVDDKTTTTSGGNLNDVNDQNAELARETERWAIANRLSLNRAKTVTLNFTTRNIGDQSPVPFLGVTLDAGLTWTTHGDKLCAKLSKNIFLLRCLAQSVSRTFLLSCYYACVHSHIDYAIRAWGHTTIANRVFRLQRKAIRIVGKIPYRDDCRRLFADLGVLTVPCSYALQCILYVHENIQDFQLVSSVHSHETRGAGNLYTPFNRLLRTRNFRYWGVTLYNLIPDHIRLLDYRKFKRIIKERFVKGGYYNLSECIGDEQGLVAL